MSSLSIGILGDPVGGKFQESDKFMSILTIALPLLADRRATKGLIFTGGGRKYFAWSGRTHKGDPVIV